MPTSFPPKLSRRRLLALGGACVPAFALPQFVPAVALGGDGRPPASQRITMAYIGVGPRGLLNCQEALGCAEAQVVAVCDVWQHVLQRAKQTVDAHYKTEDCKAYVDFREILQRDDIDAVSIASPDHWHVPMSVMAAKAGKDVSVEKPLGVCIGEDLLCREVIKRYNRVFQYGTEARASPACRFGAELVRNGYIGKVKHIRVKAPNSARGGSTKPLPVPAGLDYQLWLGPAPWRPYTGCPNGGGNWFHVYDYAIGFIAGWGAHPLDLLQWAFDMHKQGLWEVEGKGSIPKEGCNDVVVDWDVNIRFGSGVTMEYWAEGVPKQEEPQLARLGNYAQLIGEQGWVALYYASMDCQPQSLRDVKLAADAIRLPVSEGQERNFIRCVRTRETPVSNIDDAVHSDIISHVCELAIRLGRKLVWDPNEEKFLGDDEALRMMHRAHRHPWYLQP